MSYLRNLFITTLQVIWLALSIIFRQCWHLLSAFGLSLFIIGYVLLSALFVIVMSLFGHKTSLKLPNQQASIDL